MSFRESHTRRSAIRLGLMGLGAAALARPAFAAPGMTFPLRIAYARVTPEGFVQIRSAEQEQWTRMATRLGGLVSMLTPLQPSDMLGGGLPKLEGETNCILVARKMAADAGVAQVILYATADGQIHPKPGGDNWFADTFASLWADVEKDNRASGEAHLLSVEGGMPLVSATADAAPRDLFNLIDGGRNPEREVLIQLTAALELRLQDAARMALESQRSIAD